MNPYAELHAHSNFSFLEGASHIEELVLRARELLSLGDRQPLDGHLVFELPEVRVAGDDCAAQALGEGGGEGVRVADTAGRLQTSGGQSQRPVDLVGLDRGLVNEREGLLRRLDSLTIFYGVEHLT